ncbi:gamma-glutamylaminecyclotransferase-like [Amphiura filiformis]|uniref:gamma-glutamylaminecyclotransferase-like n=1 Tax=Amphiura filiformis TaxID=82378 RepID=UPI003B216DEE
MSHLVFTYGTLKNGQPNHELMTKSEKGHATFVGEAKTVEKWPLVVASEFNIPFVLDKPGVGHHILGEVYRVDEEMLHILDEVERCPEWYQRKCLTVTMETVANKADTSGKSMDTKDNSAIQECYFYVVQNYKDELLDLTFNEKYDAYGNPNHAYTPLEEIDMNLDELKDYLTKFVMKQ